MPQTCTCVLGAVLWACHLIALLLLLLIIPSLHCLTKHYHSWGDWLRESKQGAQVSQPQWEPGLSPGGSLALNPAICPVPHTSVPPQLQAFWSSHSTWKEKSIATTAESHTNLKLERSAAQKCTPGTEKTLTFSVWCIYPQVDEVLRTTGKQG